MDAYAVRYPTNVADVARVIEQVARIAVEDHKDLPPILHFQATEAMTKYDSESPELTLLAHEQH
jgi:dTDP-4-dehydrorhamnose reductase